MSQSFELNPLLNREIENSPKENEKDARERVALIGESPPVALSPLETPQPTAISEPVQSAPRDNETHSENEEVDMEYYLAQTYLIMRPVLACILLSVFWVKITNPTALFFGNAGSGIIQSGSTGAGSNIIQTSASSAGSSLTTAIIIIAQIIGATIVLAILFIYGCLRIMTYFLMVLVTVLLGFFGYLILSQVFTIWNIAFDYISLVFILWNFSAAGVYSIFGTAPMWIQQLYLIMMSSMLAYNLTLLPDITTWILLGLLAVWDLIAVLCPFGPLRLLIESSKDKKQEIPALLYSVMVWLMLSEVEENGESGALASNAKRPSSTISPAAPPDTSTNEKFGHSSIENTVIEAHDRPSVDEDSDDEGSAKSGIKLGLGDFVFYSVLVSRAAFFDYVTTYCCLISVLVGLASTIILLAINQKALPALPISIALGIFFYFLSMYVLPVACALILETSASTQAILIAPFVGNLIIFTMNASSLSSSTLDNGSYLLIGKINSGGQIMT